MFILDVITISSMLVKGVPDLNWIEPELYWLMKSQQTILPTPVPVPVLLLCPNLYKNTQNAMFPHSTTRARGLRAERLNGNVWDSAYELLWSNDQMKARARDVARKHIPGGVQNSQ